MSHTKVEIKNRFTGEVMFTAEVDATLSTNGLKLGAAVKIVFKARANLARANLADANLADADLAGANLADANLADADLADANLADADLAGANLAGANLAGANLAGANLARANLADADLAGANLAGANLAGANLAGANLARANLADADLAGANLAGAKNILDCGTPHGYRIVVNVFEGAVRIWAGCRSLTFKEAVKHWSKRADRNLMPPLLAYIKAAVKINGWALEVKKPRAKAKGEA